MTFFSMKIQNSVLFYRMRSWCQIYLQYTYDSRLNHQNMKYKS